MFLLKVFAELNRQKVRYLVVGGVAATLHGNPRFTKDLDLFVDLEETNLKKLVKAVKNLGYVPRVPVKPEDFVVAENRAKWIKEKGMLAFTFLNPNDMMEMVDILIASPVPFRKAYRAREVFDSEGVEVPTISAEHLIQMKEKAGRTQDLQDIAILKAALKKREARADEKAQQGQ